MLIIKFFSVNFTSIEIEGERVSSSQNERNLGGWGGGGGGRGGKRKGGGGARGGGGGGGEGLEKEQGGRGGSKLRNLKRTCFLNVP